MWYVLLPPLLWITLFMQKAFFLSKQNNRKKNFFNCATMYIVYFLKPSFVVYVWCMWVTRRFLSVFVAFFNNSFLFSFFFCFCKVIFIFISIFFIYISAWFLRVKIMHFAFAIINFQTIACCCAYCIDIYIQLHYCANN